MRQMARRGPDMTGIWLAVASRIANAAAPMSAATSPTILQTGLARRSDEEVKRVCEAARLPTARPHLSFDDAVGGFFYLTEEDGRGRRLPAGLLLCATRRPTCADAGQDATPRHGQGSYGFQGLRDQWSSNAECYSMNITLAILAFAAFSASARGPGAARRRHGQDAGAAALPAGWVGG